MRANSIVKSISFMRRSYSLKVENVDVNILKKRIIDNTALTREHLTPEIALRLITPQCKLYNEPYSSSIKVFENDPFWGFYWPGGQALARYIIKNPHIVKGKSILEIGCGSGAISIASGLCQANEIVANDIDNVATIVAQMNAELNSVKIKTSTQNLIGSTCENYDVIFLGDMFYDENIASLILPWLKRLRTKGKRIFIGDPGRHGLTDIHLNLMKKITSYDLTETCCLENNGFKCANVWEMK